MDHVLGARMMGGGFGGCTINLVKSNGIEGFKQVVAAEYYHRFQQEPLFYIVKLMGGAGELH
jgi:galactokinase